MRPQNLNDPESNQAPLCRRVKLGEERCVTTQRTPAYKITEITGNTALKKKKKMNKHENSNILQNDFEKLVKTLILLHFRVLLILFMLSFLLSFLLRDEVKSKSRYNLS